MLYMDVALQSQGYVKCPAEAPRGAEICFSFLRGTNANVI